MSRRIGPRRPGPRWWIATAMVVLRHPELWATAIGTALRLARPGWWRRPPFLPLPDRAYLDFRLETQYGAADPDPGDVVTYLRWVRRTERIR